MKRFKKLSEGNKMFLNVMGVFIFFAGVFIVFDDFDRSRSSHFNLLDESNDWHLLYFALVMVVALGVLLYHYSQRMDQRIDREQVEKENRIRRELTQNISHELKTPVAGIKAYCETILDNPDIDKETTYRFIGRAHEQAERLSNLLTDISIINRMDYASTLFEKERVNVAEVVAEVIQDVAVRAHQNEIIINNCLPQSIVVQGNYPLLRSVFTNLINNAIKYAGKGSTVELSVEKSSDAWNFTVSDNGPGVDPIHLSRIFERFYRVDKGRSRALGGTGLGLSIVKNAILWHGGNIIAMPTNPDGSGLTFKFDIRK